MRTAAVLGLALLVVASTGAQAPQSPAPPQTTFQSGVDVVHVDVSVLDKDRRPVRDLTAGDFVVKEDGKVRPVVAFGRVELPLPPPAPPAQWMRDIPADVVSNQMPREGRLVTIVFDWTVQAEDMPFVRPTAENIVNQLGPGDVAAVIFVRRTVAQGFTADRRLLLSAINRTFASIADNDPDVQSGECYCGVCSLETMTTVADALRDVPERRKMLVYIGRRVPVISAGPCGAEIKAARERLLRSARVANMAIHSVDAALLQSLAPGADTRGIPSSDRTGIVGGNLQRQGDLSVYPEQTGGRAIQNTNAPQEQMPALFAESQSYYVLAFTPAAARADGAYHDIKVEVKRKDVSVHPRQGYYAPAAAAPAKPSPPGDAPQSLVKALAGIWPATGLPMSVSAAAFALPGKPLASIAVVVRAREQLEPAAAEHTSLAVNVLAGAYDRDGKPLSTHVQTLHVLPPAGTPRDFEYEALARLELKPGRHEIRVAIADPAHNFSGSVYTYVDVPDFTKAPLSLSGVMLGTSGPLQGSPLTDILPLTPTARRRFLRTESVAAYVKAYEGGKDPIQPVTLTAGIVDAANQSVFERQTTLFAAGSERAEDYRFDLPLEMLRPGHYLLTIAAAGRGKERVRHDVRFEVVGPAGTTTAPSPLRVESVLRAAAMYLQQYEKDVSAVVAEEDYVQRIISARQSRRLRSDMLVILDSAAGWVGFRDVFEVDGDRVRDRDERLAKLFMKPSADNLDQARRVANEASRYNLNPVGGGVSRTINQPFIALKFLRAANQPRSTFWIEPTPAGAQPGTVLLNFTETAKPRLIVSPDNAAAGGFFRIDAATGRVVASELRIQTGRTLVTISVRYDENPKLGLWVPVSMDEHYTSVPPIEGHATYSNFRQFKVDTETTIIK